MLKIGLTAKQKQFLLGFAVIFIAVLLRLLPHPPNVAPIGAMALFGGVYLNKKYALFLPLVTMLVSDVFLGFHSTMGFVYGSFVLSGLIGMWLRGHKKAPVILGATLFSSLLFFVITNFGVWLMGNLPAGRQGMYPMNLHGLLECYVMAIPFFRNTILGDLFYVGLFFGGYEVVLKVFRFRMSDARFQMNSKE
jgi:hypothetical protein